VSCACPTCPMRVLDAARPGSQRALTRVGQKSQPGARRADRRAFAEPPRKDGRRCGASPLGHYVPCAVPERAGWLLGRSTAKRGRAEARRCECLRVDRPPAAPGGRRPLENGPVDGAAIARLEQEAFHSTLPRVASMAARSSHNHGGIGIERSPASVFGGPLTRR
jgi:hypothetical protein